MRDSKAARRLQPTAKPKPKSKAQATPRKKTHAQLKKKVDEWFSKYIRAKYADADGIVRCFTCERPDHVSRMQAGHFASRRHMATRWDEDNVRPQCVSCNIYRHGEQWLFGRNLDGEQPGRAEAIMRRAHEPRKFTVAELNELAIHYRGQYLWLASNKRVITRGLDPGAAIEEREARFTDIL